MEPVSFKEANTDGGKFPYFKDENGNSVICWRVSIWERIKLLFSGKIFTVHVGFVAPTDVTIKNPIK